MQFHSVEYTSESQHAVEHTTCCIVGGGPAGAVLALLLARQGIAVTLLEKHNDFLRDFRGDTIHPSTLQVLDEIGLAERLLALPHSRVDGQAFVTSRDILRLASFQHLRTKYPFVALIPQHEFLAFITKEASQYSTFRLLMNAQAEEVIEEQGVVQGVRYRAQDGLHELRALLTIGADGRSSPIRKQLGWQPVQSRQAMDVLWFRLPKHADEEQQIRVQQGNGHLLVMLPRSDYWQIGYVIPKGGYQAIRAEGIDALQRDLASMIPSWRDRFEMLTDWKQLPMLSVESSYLRRWHGPGMLLIGDAAHVMSPIGGVGINYAIQDAVVAANLLTKPLQRGKVTDAELAQIRKQRIIPIRVIQVLQNLLQRTLLTKALATKQPLNIPRFLYLLPRIPVLRTIPARLIAIGLVRVHVQASLRAAHPVASHVPEHTVATGAGDL
ncbi:MAG TPA: FAD-dependent oxidoreductase [Ktedonobacteraceae bacterium]|jgi:2-polyprenyl-6-methoxyphenol hydroxylase-like FAD-dependent oxidoreductase|nr:FAD-dependent oxidoreductase [Ktedonobacteraceae bacterium]